MEDIAVFVFTNGDAIFAIAVVGYLLVRWLVGLNARIPPDDQNASGLDGT